MKNLKQVQGYSINTDYLFLIQNKIRQLDLTKNAFEYIDRILGFMQFLNEYSGLDKNKKILKEIQLLNRILKLNYLKLNFKYLVRKSNNLIWQKI